MEKLTTTVALGARRRVATTAIVRNLYLNEQYLVRRHSVLRFHDLPSRSRIALVSSNPIGADVCS